MNLSQIPFHSTTQKVSRTNEFIETIGRSPIGRSSFTSGALWLLVILPSQTPVAWVGWMFVRRPSLWLAQPMGCLSLPLPLLRLVWEAEGTPGTGFGDLVLLISQSLLLRAITATESRVYNFLGIWVDISTPWLENYSNPNLGTHNIPLYFYFLLAS